MVTTHLTSQIDGFGDEIDEWWIQPHPTRLHFTFSGQITPEDADVDTQGFECTVR